MRLRNQLLFMSAALILALIDFTAAPLAQQASTPATGKKEQIILTSEVRVGDTLLKPGDYQIQHVFEGKDHVMVFTELVGPRSYLSPRPGKEAARAKCTFGATDKRIEHTQVSLGLNSSGQTVIKKISIKGEQTEHLFESNAAATQSEHQHD
ncbi:MAG: hypothetical protein HY644_00600 [Acidobacteria bacterium]|nr:hypothetical protein [Acidobacteriota bacterium]